MARLTACSFLVLQLATAISQQTEMDLSNERLRNEFLISLSLVQAYRLSPSNPYYISFTENDTMTIDANLPTIKAT